MTWGRNVFNAALLLLAVAYVWEAFRYNPTPRLFPLLVGVPMLLFTALQAVIDLSPYLSRKYAEMGTINAERLAGKVVSGRAKEDPRLSWQEFEAFLWVGLAVGLSLLLGMFWGIPLFLFLFLRLRHTTGWMISAGLPLGTLAVMDLLFVRFFQIPLYPGLLE